MDVHPTKNGINRYWSIPISGFMIYWGQWPNRAAVYRCIRLSRALGFTKIWADINGWRPQFGKGPLKFGCHTIGTIGQKWQKIRKNKNANWTSTILGQTIWKEGVIINDRDRWDDFKSPWKKKTIPFKGVLRCFKWPPLNKASYQPFIWWVNLTSSGWWYPP
jgi:hypothetical protein